MTFPTFFSTIKHVSGCNDAEAEKVFSVYKKLKVIKISAHDGITLVHGSFFDKEVIINAINYKK